MCCNLGFLLVCLIGGCGVRDEEDAVDSVEESHCGDYVKCFSDF